MAQVKPTINEAKEARILERAAELMVWYMKTQPTFGNYEVSDYESYKVAKEFFDELLLSYTLQQYPEFHEKWAATLPTS